MRHARFFLPLLVLVAAWIAARWLCLLAGAADWMRVSHPDENWIIFFPRGGSSVLSGAVTAGYSKQLEIEAIGAWQTLKDAHSISFFDMLTAVIRIDAGSSLVALGFGAVLAVIASLQSPRRFATIPIVWLVLRNQGRQTHLRPSRLKRIAARLHWHPCVAWAAVAACLVTWGTAFLLLHPRWICRFESLPWGLTALFTSFLLCYGCAYFAALSLSSHGARASIHSPCVCGQCRYPLASGDSVCPECGKAP